MAPTPQCVRVRVRFEAAHRLPALPGKCQNVHGHSWQAWVTYEGHPSSAGVVADFSAIKRGVQDWVDAQFDHATLLGVDDPLAAMLQGMGLKVYVFGRDPYTAGLHHPTVEAVAEAIRRRAATLQVPGAKVVEVEVAETENNHAYAFAPTPVREPITVPPVPPFGAELRSTPRTREGQS